MLYPIFELQEKTDEQYARQEGNHQCAMKAGQMLFQKSLWNWISASFPIDFMSPIARIQSMFLQIGEVLNRIVRISSIPVCHEAIHPG
jgi:hypothetical protein